MAEPSQARSIATLDKILAAAEALVARAGVGGLTMDGVAQEAGISKGGVLHHFRSKESLIASLASRRLDSLRQDVDRHIAERDGQPQKTLGGMIDHASATYGCDDGFSRAMLTAAVENSQSLERFRSMFADTFERIRAESANSDAAVALMFAVIGLQVARTLGIAELEPSRAAAVFEALRTLTSALPPEEIPASIADRARSDPDRGRPLTASATSWRRGRPS